MELLWDQMWRSTVNYGRKGLPVQAISAVDLALWLQAAVCFLPRPIPDWTWYLGHLSGTALQCSW